MSSRPILRRLCCVTWATLLNVCLEDDDLRELGHWPEGPGGDVLSPGVQARASLGRACHKDDEQLAALSDHLDLRFLDTVLTVRQLPDGELASLEHAWRLQPDGRSLPGLIWALCTDERPEAHTRGVRLAHEALAVATRQLVDGVPTA